MRPPAAGVLLFSLVLQQVSRCYCAVPTTTEDPFQWLDSLVLKYDRSKAEALLQAQDWNVLKRELEARQTYACATAVVLHDLLQKEEQLEYIEAVLLVCAHRDYFLTAREAWLANAEDLENRLMTFRDEWKKARPSQWALVKIGAADFYKKWESRLTALSEELNGYMDDHEDLFPTHTNVKADDIVRQAGVRRTAMVSLLMGLKKDYGLLTAENRRRPYLMAVVVLALVGAVFTWSGFLGERSGVVEDPSPGQVNR